MNLEEIEAMMQDIEDNEDNRMERNQILFGDIKENNADLLAELDQLEAQEVKEQMEIKAPAPVTHEEVIVKPIPNSHAMLPINLDDTVPGEGPANNLEQQSMQAL